MARTRPGGTTLKKLYAGLIVCGLFAACSSSANIRQSLKLVNAQRAFGYLTAQTSFGPRNPGSRGHAACREYLVRQLGMLTDTVEVQHFQPTDSRGERAPAMTNIIGRIAPQRARRYLLCAHWDTRPRADRDPDMRRRHQPILGANDGASGVAVLLEVAKVLKSVPPRVGVDIVFFDGEDFGEEGRLEDYFFGSREFARRWRGPKHEMAVLVDMVGDRNLQLPVEGISARAAPEVVDRVWSAAERIGEPTFVRSMGVEIQDDHVPLIEAGWRAIDIIDFSYPYWHTTADTPDKCSPGSLASVARVLLATIMAP